MRRIIHTKRTIVALSTMLAMALLSVALPLVAIASNGGGSGGP